MSLYSIILILHILAVMVSVGSATLVDYLHLVSLRKKKLEKGLVKIYPFVTKLINLSLLMIYLTGITLVYQNSSILNNPLFITKAFLVLIVTVNGIYLQRSVSPHLDKCVIKGTKYCTPYVLKSSAIAGSISIVTWYSIVILSLSKTMNYSAKSFIISYLAILIFATTTAYFVERKARKWRA